MKTYYINAETGELLYTDEYIPVTEVPTESRVVQAHTGKHFLTKSSWTSGEKICPFCGYLFLPSLFQYLDAREKK